MLAYIPAPWIRHGICQHQRSHEGRDGQGKLWCPDGTKMDKAHRPRLSSRLFCRPWDPWARGAWPGRWSGHQIRCWEVQLIPAAGLYWSAGIFASKPQYARHIALAVEVMRGWGTRTKVPYEHSVTSPKRFTNTARSSWNITWQWDMQRHDPSTTPGWKACGGYWSRRRGSFLPLPSTNFKRKPLEPQGSFTKLAICGWCGFSVTYLGDGWSVGLVVVMLGYVGEHRNNIQKKVAEMVHAPLAGC